MAQSSHRFHYSARLCEHRFCTPCFTPQICPLKHHEPNAIRIGVIHVRGGGGIVHSIFTYRGHLELAPRHANVGAEQGIDRMLCCYCYLGWRLPRSTKGGRCIHTGSQNINEEEGEEEEEMHVGYSLGDNGIQDTSMI